ncbi:AzlC family ABC transporter permease [Aureimonas populi]
MPFGALFGTLAVDSGLTVAQTVGFSATVYAGASQFVALQLLALSSPIWSILIAVVALNFRHVLYSASIGRHLGHFSRGEKAAAFFVLVDPLFAAAEERVGHRRLTRSYYFTFGLMLYVGWSVSTLLGAIFGGLIEDQRAFGFDLILPVYFIAQTMAFRQRAGFLPVAGVAAIVSILVYVTIGSPWHVTLGGLAGIAVAALRRPAGNGAP